MLHLVAAPTAPSDRWTALAAATRRPDVPRDVQAAIEGALAWHDEIMRHLNTIVAGLAQVDAREQACRR